MGDIASPFIADLYLSLCEYCYMTSVIKTDNALAKLLSYNYRYLDDISTANIQNLLKMLKTYSTTHCYWKEVLVVTNTTHFFIFISVLLIINL